MKARAQADAIRLTANEWKNAWRFGERYWLYIVTHGRGMIGHQTLKEFEMYAGTNLVTIPYPEDLLLSLKESKSDFEVEAKLLLAVKLYEIGRV